MKMKKNVNQIQGIIGSQEASNLDVFWKLLIPNLLANQDIWYFVHRPYSLNWSFSIVYDGTMIHSCKTQVMRYICLLLCCIGC
jgi:hypothetical protein